MVKKVRFPCLLCPYTASQPSDLNKHVRGVHAKIREHVCKECGVAFARVDSLNRHFKSVHAKIKEHVCKECGTAFAHAANMKQHFESVHLKVRKHSCHLCSYRATLSSNLKAHVKAVHTKIKDPWSSNLGDVMEIEEKTHESVVDNPQDNIDPSKHFTIRRGARGEKQNVQCVHCTMRFHIPPGQETQYLV